LDLVIFGLQPGEKFASILPRNLYSGGAGILELDSDLDLVNFFVQPGGALPTDEFQKGGTAL